ncbi:ABC transporter substrate-binding protein [Halovulum sp. GXIMD14793]
MLSLKSLLATALILLAPGLSHAQEVLRLATLKTGTVNWELDTIAHYGLDQKNGFKLEVQGMAGNPATRVAFQGGEADAMVADWLWVARQRAEGKDYVFIPYSTAVGGLLVKDDSGIDTLADLAGKQIGIAGGPVDKSWLIIQAMPLRKPVLIWPPRPSRSLAHHH